MSPSTPVADLLAEIASVRDVRVVPFLVTLMLPGDPAPGFTSTRSARA
ncbi:MAG TPA: hypothetical protein VMR89_08240 [Actinomycetota bacterium]|nr:hypothetical protein [Actinomycetota bacterium]